jgi:hypothetical protein
MMAQLSILAQIPFDLTEVLIFDLHWHSCCRFLRKDDFFHQNIAVQLEATASHSEATNAFFTQLPSELPIDVNSFYELQLNPKISMHMLDAHQLVSQNNLKVVFVFSPQFYSELHQWHR